MTDDDLFALCVYEEARGEIPEGRRAVARVIYNRIASRYFSDGTVAGTVLARDQFSWAWFDMVDGHYTRVCHTLADAEARAESLLAPAQAQMIWADCVDAVSEGKPSSGYQGGPQWQALAAEPRALLYCNTAISHPAWATPEKQVAVIGHHTFFKD